MPNILPLNPGFSTADAEYPELHAVAGVLQLTFRNWREELIHVHFKDVCAFRWQEAGSLLPNEPDDGVCELVESEWLERHINQQTISKESKHRHLRFNFNSCGQLEVLCTSFSIEP